MHHSFDSSHKIHNTLFIVSNCKQPSTDTTRKLSMIANNNNYTTSHDTNTIDTIEQSSEQDMKLIYSILTNYYTKTST